MLTGGMSASIDVLEAIKTHWAAASALVAIIPTTSLFTGTSPARDLPYCIVTVKKEREPDWQAPRVSGGLYLDYRRVTFTAYADSVPNADSAIDAIEAAFNAEFTVPNGTMLDWRPDTPDTVEEEQERASDAGAAYSASTEYVLTQQRAFA